MKVFDVEIMLPTILRYAGLFGIFYICNATYKKTGNIWLGTLINTLLWTAVTVSGTAASLGYIFWL